MILADLAQGQHAQPFVVEGKAFQQVIEMAEGRYMVALIDPGWVDPTERTVAIRSQLPAIGS